MLDSLLKEFKALVALVGLLALMFLAGYGLRECNHRIEYGALSSQYDKALQDLSTAQNSITSLTKAVNQADQTQKGLVAKITELENQKPEIKYIIKEKFILSGTETTLPQLPAQYTYLLNGQIPVCGFATKEQQYLFTTYDLVFTTDVVLSKDNTVASIQVQSSADPERSYTVPSVLNVTRIKDHRFFDPKIGLGGSITAPVFDFGVSIYTPLLHPTNSIDLLSPRISFSKSHGYLGLDLIGYNIGDPIPVLSDLWIYGGVSINEGLAPQLTFTLGSRL